MTDQNEKQNQDPVETSSNAPEYGRLLAETREAKGLGVEQVASQLRLSPKQILGMETGDPKAFASVVYTRAHLRSYARLLGMDEGKIISLFNNSLNLEDRDQSAFIKKTTSGLRPYQEETTKNGKGKGIGWLIFLIVLGIVAYAGWRYSNESFNFNSVKESLGFMNDSKEKVEKEVQEERQAVAEELTAKQAAEEKKEDKKEPENKPAEKTEVKPDQPNNAPAETSAAPVPVASQRAVNQLGTTPEEKALEEKVMADHARQLEEQKKLAEEKNKNQVQEVVKPRTLAVVQNQDGWSTVLPGYVKGTPVQINLKSTDGDCWFGIYVDGKLVDNTTLKQGGEKQFSHPLPFRITVGNKFRATVLLNGNPVNIAESGKSGTVSFQVFPEK